MATSSWLAASVAVGCLVVWVQGLHSFTLWVLTPVGLAMAAAFAIGPSARLAAQRGRNAFCATVLFLVAVLHLAWQFDWGRLQTGSSTAGLIFLFAPMYTVVVAAIAGTIVWAASEMRRGGR